MRTYELINDFPGIVFIKDAQGKYLACNPAFAEFFKISHSTVVGKTDQELGLQQYTTLLDHMNTNISQLDTNATASIHYNTILTFPNGSSKKLLVEKKPYLKNGLSGLITVALLLESYDSESGYPSKSNIETSQLATHDIPVMKEILNLIPHALMWKDINSVFLGCNQRFVAFAGLESSEQIIGKTDYDLPWDKNESDAYRLDDQNVINSKKPKLNIEEPQTLDDGTKIILLTSKVPIFDNGNNVIGVLGIYTDITDIKELEKTKREGERAVSKKVIQKLKTIAGSLSHEIRTPLAGLKLGLSGLKRFLAKGEEAYHQLEQEKTKSKSFAIKADDFTRQTRSVDRMLSHIDMSTSLMDIQLKNMVTEQISTEKFVQCDIQTCVSESLDTFPFPASVPRDCVTIAINKPFQFWGDAILLRHILWNLLSNALHFIKEEEKGEIFVSTKEQDDNYILSFKDTAKGMPSEDAEKVFSRYYSKRTNGTGLGLNFCQLVMEAFGGDIRCRAEEGQYAEFILSFPCDYASVSSSNHHLYPSRTSFPESLDPAVETHFKL